MIFPAAIGIAINLERSARARRRDTRSRARESSSIAFFCLRATEPRLAFLLAFQALSPCALEAVIDGAMHQSYIARPLLHCVFISAKSIIRSDWEQAVWERIGGFNCSRDAWRGSWRASARARGNALYRRLGDWDIPADTRMRLSIMSLSNDRGAREAGD